jgi:hypothetical protein
MTCGAPPPSDPSHLKTRGAGGKDDAVIAQCRACHIALGQEGRFSFFVKRGLDADALLTKMRALVALLGPKSSADSEARGMSPSSEAAAEEREGV